MHVRVVSNRLRTRPCRSSIVRAGFGARDGCCAREVAYEGLVTSPWGLSWKARVVATAAALRVAAWPPARRSHRHHCLGRRSASLLLMRPPGRQRPWTTTARGTFGRPPMHVACFRGWRGRSAGHFCPRASRRAPSVGPSVRRSRRGVISMASCSRGGAGARGCRARWSRSMTHPGRRFGVSSSAVSEALALSLAGVHAAPSWACGR